VARFAAGVTFSSTVDAAGVARFNAGATASTLDVQNAARFDGGVTVKGSAGNTTFDTVGNLTVGATLTVNGNFFVSGTVTTVNRTDLQVDDKLIVLGRTLATDALLDQAGFQLGTDSTRNLQWLSGSTAWTSSQNFNVASGGAYKINGASVLFGSVLGSSITTSSLTQVGTIANGTWQGSIIGATYGGTSRNLSGAGASGGIVFRDSLGLNVQSAAGTATQVLLGSANGTPTWTNLTALTGLTADRVTVTNTTTGAGPYYIMFADATSGAVLPRVDGSGITFNATTNILSCVQIEATIDGGTW
jgi:hypothetical protein